MCVCVCVCDGYRLIGWFQIIGVFTLFPLLVKDGLVAPYFICCAIFIAIISVHKQSEKRGVNIAALPATYIKLFAVVRRIFLILSCLGVVVLHLMEIFYTPPTRYPDLYPALFSIFGFLNFCVYFIFFVAWQIMLQSDNVTVKVD